MGFAKDQTQTLRGLACLLLVTYHVVGADSVHGLRVTEGALRWFNDGLAYLRMPLFTFLSGLVYGSRPFTGNTSAFFLGKARRLLLPMLTVGTLFAFFQSWKNGAYFAAEPWYLLHLKPVAHFWFVESLFWVFSVIWVLERTRLIHTGRGFLLALGASCALYLGVRGWPWLSIEGAIYLLPYFLLGLGCCRFSLADVLRSTSVRMVLALAALGAIVLMGLPVPNPDRRTVGILAAGMALCLLLLGSGFSQSGLAWMARFSYSIYLFHVFFSAPTRMALSGLGMRDWPVNVALGLVAGLAGPILLEMALSRFRWPALLFLGKSKPATASPSERSP